MAKPKKPSILVADNTMPDEESMYVTGSPRNMDIPSEPVQFNAGYPDPNNMDFSEPAFDITGAQDKTPVESNGIPTALVEAAQTPQQQLLAMMNTPERQAMMKELQDKSRQSIEEQRAGVNQNAQDIAALDQRSPKVNLQPLNALVDTWTGSNLSQHYQQPETPEQYKMKVLALKDQLQKQRQGLTTEEINLLKSQLALSNPLALSRMENANQRTSLRQDEQAVQAVKAIDNHPLMQASTKQLGQLEIDRHTIENSKMITPQILHEVSNGIANALGGGRSVGLGMASMQDLSTLKTNLASLEQKITNAPQEGASPAIKKQVVDTLNRLEEAYGSYQSHLAEKLSKGRLYQNNPQAREALKQAVEKYKYVPKSNAAPMPVAKKPAATPQVGAIVEGHKYLGGDPADPGSWEEVK